MSKIVHPYAHRLIILRDWKSRWFADHKKYCDYLKGDVLITSKFSDLEFFCLLFLRPNVRT